MYEPSYLFKLNVINVYIHPSLATIWPAYHIFIRNSSKKCLCLCSVVVTFFYVISLINVVEQLLVD